MKKEDDPFKNFNDIISLVLVLIVIVLFFGFLFSCSPKARMYNIYLEHQPNEPLYTTSSIEDAFEYYEQYKPFHSDMYITTIGEENNLITLKK